MVIGAPTGSGKTVLFELAIIRMLMQAEAHSQAVYMGPSKALIAERVRDWKQRLGPLDIAVADLTGDTNKWDVRAAKNAKIIVTTPDKWDMVTRRKSEQAKLLANVRLVLIDEVHLLRDSRGPRLEAVVSRMKIYGNDIRFIALSATVPNIQDVAEWLGSAEKPARVFSFGEEYRPVPLQKFVYGYPRNEAAGYNGKALNQKLIPLIREHGKSKPVLIFVATRNATIQCAEHLAQAYAKMRDGSERLPWPRPSPGSSSRLDHPKLAATVQQGVAFHHAGLSQQDRKRIEEMFLQGVISILCSTSTLAIGTNLPAHTVIVRGTQIYDDNDWRELSELDLIQMLGRAGRPSFDKEGCAIIMTSEANRPRYVSLTSGRTIIESQFGEELMEHINTEIGLNQASSFESLLEWLRASFFSIRLRRDPDKYMKSDADMTFNNHEDALVSTLETALGELEKNGLANPTEENIQSTELGDIMSKHYVSCATIAAFTSKEIATTRDVIHTIASAAEFSSLRIRQSEKQFYSQLKAHAGIKFPPKDVSGRPEKVSLLLQSALGGVQLKSLPNQPSDGNPTLDLFSVFRIAPRIATAALDIALAKKDGAFATAAFEVQRAVLGKSWDESDSALCRIDGCTQQCFSICDA